MFNIDWALQNKIEYLTFYLGAPLFFTFLALLFAEKNRKPMIAFSWSAGILFSLHVLLVSPRVFTAMTRSSSSTTSSSSWLTDTLVLR